MSGAQERTNRRPVGFWEPFNQWWRAELEVQGLRPTQEAISEWYARHASETWCSVSEAPSLKELRTHAKCLRSTQQVRDYFRRYRAQRRAVHPNKSDTAPQSEDEDAQEAGVAGVHGTITSASSLPVGHAAYTADPGLVAATQPVPSGRFSLPSQLQRRHAMAMLTGEAPASPVHMTNTNIRSELVEAPARTASGPPCAVTVAAKLVSKPPKGGKTPYARYTSLLGVGSQPSASVPSQSQPQHSQNPSTAALSAGVEASMQASPTQVTSAARAPFARAGSANGRLQGTTPTKHGSCEPDALPPAKRAAVRSTNSGPAADVGTSVRRTSNGGNTSLPAPPQPYAAVTSGFPAWMQSATAHGAAAAGPRLEADGQQHPLAQYAYCGAGNMYDGMPYHPAHYDGYAGDRPEPQGRWFPSIYGAGSAPRTQQPMTDAPADNKPTLVKVEASQPGSSKSGGPASADGAGAGRERSEMECFYDMHAGWAAEGAGAGPPEMPNVPSSHAAAPMRYGSAADTAAMGPHFHSRQPAPNHLPRAPSAYGLSYYPGDLPPPYGYPHHPHHMPYGYPPPQDHGAGGPYPGPHPHDYPYYPHQYQPMPYPPQHAPYGLPPGPGMHGMPYAPPPKAVAQQDLQQYLMANRSAAAMAAAAAAGPPEASSMALRPASTAAAAGGNGGRMRLLGAAPAKAKPGLPPQEPLMPGRYVWQATHRQAMEDGEGTPAEPSYCSIGPYTRQSTHSHPAPSTREEGAGAEAESCAEGGGESAATAAAASAARDPMQGVEVAEELANVPQGVDANASPASRYHAPLPAAQAPPPSAEEVWQVPNPAARGVKPLGWPAVTTAAAAMEPPAPLQTKQAELAPAPVPASARAAAVTPPAAAAAAPPPEPRGQGSPSDAALLMRLPSLCVDDVQAIANCGDLASMFVLGCDTPLWQAKGSGGNGRQVAPQQGSVFSPRLRLSDAGFADFLLSDDPLGPVPMGMAAAVGSDAFGAPRSAKALQEGPWGIPLPGKLILESVPGYGTDLFDDLIDVGHGCADMAAIVRITSGPLAPSCGLDGWHKPAAGHAWRASELGGQHHQGGRRQ